MSLFNKLFKSAPVLVTPTPPVVFGRFSDLYKTDAQQAAWEQALALYEQGELRAAYEQFLQYLYNNEHSNLHYTPSDNGWEFSFYQGSKVVKGYISAEQVWAEAKIAKAEALSVGFMRRLIEHNYALRYTRYALDPDHQLTILFDSATADASPYKLYYALKELAVQADKQDDLLLDEFKVLQPVDQSPLQTLSPAVQAAKYAYFEQTLRQGLAALQHENTHEQQAGGLAYLLLSITYKLDYLLKPEGTLMETFERIHRIYFTNENKTPIQKLIYVEKELQMLLQRDPAAIHAELYDTVSTFGVVTPAGHEKLVEIIDTELPNTDWYLQNNGQHIAFAITQYIAGFALFNYALPLPDRHFLHLFFEITEYGYFASLGYAYPYYTTEGALIKKNIVQRIEEITAAHKAQFPALTLPTTVLRFEDLLSFSHSYFVMLQQAEGYAGAS